MWNWILANKEWLFSGVGVAVVTAVIGILWRLGVLRVPRINSPDNLIGQQALFLQGNWHGYYIAWIDEDVVTVHETWTINRDKKGRLTAAVQTLDGRSLSFSGSVDFERDQFLVRLTATEHPEAVECRFKMPIPGNDRVVLGLFLGVDFSGRITAGACLISRTTLEDAEIQKIFSDRLKVSPTRRAIRLKD